MFEKQQKQKQKKKHTHKKVFSTNMANMGGMAWYRYSKHGSSVSQLNAHTKLPQFLPCKCMSIL